MYNITMVVYFPELLNSCLPVCWSACLSVCLLVYLSVYLSVCLPVCLSNAALTPSANTTIISEI